jgi:branched-chain amino acid transport system permease protein
VTQVLLSGLAIGAIYGLVGMGFAIAFYVTRVINFAEGQLLMVGVMVAAWFARTGLNPWLAVVLGIAAAAAVGAVTYIVAVRPVLAFDRFSFAWLVSTLGVALILENGAALIWGPKSRSFPALHTGTSVPVGSATLTLH